MGSELDGETTFHYRHHVCFIITRVQIIPRLDSMDPTIRTQAEKQINPSGIGRLGKFHSPEFITFSSVVDETEWSQLFN